MSDAIIGLVLDRSGSMGFMWQDAVGGFNTFKNEQAETDGTAWLILNYFDNEVKQKYFAWDTKDIPDLGVTDKEIHPRGSTALIDATIKTIKDTDRWLSENEWFTGKTFVVLITDGMENASKTAPSVLKELIQEKESAGWEFIYLAANVDTEATASQYGFDLSRSMTYDSNTVSAGYGTMSAAVTRSRVTGQAVEFDESERDVTRA